MAASGVKAGASMRIKIFPDSETLAAFSAHRIVKLIDATLKHNERFSLALSGGSTPQPTYRAIAETYSNTVDWGRVHIFFGDERTVPPDHADSNYKMAKETLIDHLNIPDENIYRIAGENDPTTAARDYEAVIRDYFKHEPPGFDLTLLGIGDDGHTASLFPHTSALTLANQWVAANPVEKLNTTRITLTPELINLSSNVMFIVSGDSKSSALHQIIDGDSNPQEFPAQLIQLTDGHLLWALDEAAAAQLVNRGDD